MVVVLVGDLLWLADGLTDGLADGLADGLTEGVPVGAGLMVAVPAVGAVVGDFVTSAVGDPVSAGLMVAVPVLVTGVGDLVALATFPAFATIGSLLVFGAFRAHACKADMPNKAIATFICVREGGRTRKNEC